MFLNDRVLGLFALLLAALLAWKGWDLQAPFSYEPVGPRAFPLLLAAVIAGCGAWLLVRGREHAEPNPPGANTRIATMAALVTGYALAFVSLGFIVSTALMATLVGRLFGGRWHYCAIGGVGLGLGLYLLFDKVFEVVLPMGVLNFGS
ncbi:tripartite tricarboxylate transporter TctB family protein [Tepidimonas taiwanensis]|uniref:tripartite tricarboxylate transporter TctB family protein n=1 Tax=Tepidimonas taiwanensis TaxID=307486 RepID=UPI000734A5BF|nr:tripartite tricarboxylate transporter TctB family protein [Tepidimonas taiwanensis]